MAVGQPIVKRDRRRYKRWPVEIDVRVFGNSDRETAIRLLDLSRGGCLLSGSVEIKRVLFRSKRYTHEPIPALIVIGDDPAYRGRVLLGRCKYLRKMRDGSYQAGFAFAQLQPRVWVNAVVSARQCGAGLAARNTATANNPVQGCAPFS